MSQTNSAFRFAIMGAGGISNKFCEAVKLLEGCCVTAIASKSAERAAAFAEKNGIAHSYDNYQKMLDVEKPDCVYIGVTTDAHYELSRLCLESGIPVLCEKAMFTNAAQAKEIFALSKEKNVFAMEAMWSRFLPAVRQAKAWVEEGAIGEVVCGDCRIGFAASKDPEKRYYSPALGGGAGFDLTVYCYEILTYMIDRPAQVVRAEAVFADTGVDITDYVLLRFPAEKDGSKDVLATAVSTFLAAPDEKMELTGTEGRIVVPFPSHAEEAFLYDKKENCVQHFVDGVTENGFTYEAEEVMRCIRAGKCESETVPHSLTIACAEMFDQMLENRK